MDLIYADDDMHDIGVIKNPLLDLAYGADENNFVLTVSMTNHICRPGYYIYAEGTEYGGIVDSITVNNDEKTIKYSGRTWHGMLETKIIEPASGEDYYIVSGELNTVIGRVITKLGLGDLFEASEASSGMTVTNYRFKRYVDGYAGLRKMVNSKGGKLHFEFHDGKMVVSAVPLVDYSRNEEFDSSQLKFEITKTFNYVNHLICLGRGTLRNRDVVHLYVDENKNISTTQTFTGTDEVVAKYDYSSVESLEDLIAEGTDELKELINSDTLDISLDPEQEYDVDDIVGAVDEVTGIKMSAPITKKIVSIDKTQIFIEYQAGE